jgi:hypothetical protein
MGKISVPINIPIRLRAAFSALMVLILYKPTTTFSQESRSLKKMEIREVHLLNGMGWGFPLGETSEILKPKFSGNTALFIYLKDQKYFLNPSLDVMVYGYEQLEKDLNFPSNISNGRAIAYTLNVSGGIRKKLDKFTFSFLLGPGISLVAEPRAISNEVTNTITLSRKKHLSPTLKAGTAVDYQIGNVYLFIETSWQNHFVGIQGRNMNQIVLMGGLKTNITRVTDRVIGIIEENVQK